VSVVARPAKVSVEVGRVRVPVLLIDEITGLVKVLLVSVCVLVEVVTLFGAMMLERVAMFYSSLLIIAVDVSLSSIKTP
jgi:hypothetical protein